MKSKTLNPQSIPAHLLTQIVGGYKVNLRNQNRNRMERDGLVRTCPKVTIANTPPN